MTRLSSGHPHTGTEMNEITRIERKLMLKKFTSAEIPVHRIVHRLHDMKFVERQLRTREVFSRPLDEGLRHVAAHPLDVFASAAVLLEKCLESTQSIRVLPLCGEDDLRRIQVHKDRDVIVPSLAGGLVESDIADP